MKTRHALRMLLVLVASAFTGGSLPTAAKPDEKAQKAAGQWLSLVDSGTRYFIK